MASLPGNKRNGTLLKLLETGELQKNPTRFEAKVLHFTDCFIVVVVVYDAFFLAICVAFVS